MLNKRICIGIKLFKSMKILVNRRWHNIRASIITLAVFLCISLAKAQEDEASNAAVEPEMPARLRYLEVPVVVEPGLEPELPILPGPIPNVDSERDAEFISLVNSIQQYSETVELIEEQGGAWDINLAESLTTIGGIEQQQGNHIEAIAAFSRAMQINRIANGLYTLEQLPLLEKMIDSYTALENWEQVDLFNNYLFYIAHRTYGVEDPRIISSLERLASWNMEAFSIGFGDALGVRLSNAQMLYRSAIRIVVVHFGETDQRLPVFLRKLASSAYQVAMYPEYAAQVAQPEFRSQQESFRRKLNEGSSIIPGSFQTGEAALLAVIDYHNKAPYSAYALAEAITHLGDWYILFDRRRRQAEDIYFEAWELLRAEEGGEYLAGQLFGQVVPLPTFVDTPKNLEMRSSDTKARSAMEHDIADLSFSVTPLGAVRDVEMLGEETEENKMKLSPLLRALRMSKFRPTLIEGRPVRSDGHVFRYRYWY